MRKAYGVPGKVVGAVPGPWLRATIAKLTRWTYSIRVTATSLVFEGDFEFDPEIVWDALTDSELLSGWLAEASVVPEIGGEFVLHRIHRAEQPVSHGRIVALRHGQEMHIVSTDGPADAAQPGRLEFTLQQLPIGSRGTSTRLTVRIHADIAPAAQSRVKANWLTNLDQLDDLLRGHPVDWSNWDRDRHAAWEAHLAEAEHSTA
jgi:uncharacterized protein YndB with AHSA1/START domain